MHFKSVAHQLYRTTDLHYDIRTAGISHMNSHPELYIESIADTSFENYVNEMSRPGVMSRIERSYENCEIYDNSQDH